MSTYGKMKQAMRAAAHILICNCALLAGVYAAWSCTKAELESIKENVQENQEKPDGKVTVHFHTGVADHDSKASENTVSDVTIAVYHMGLLTEILSLEDGGSGSLELNTGRNYTYYAWANIRLPEIPDSEEEIKVLRLEVDPAEPAGGLPMSDSGDFRVSMGGTAVNIMFSRLYARVNFRVDLSDIPELEISAVRIRQAATSVTAFSESAAVATADGDRASLTEISTLNSGGEVVLHVPENCQGVLLPENTDPWEKVPDNIPDKAGLCTYLEVEAEFSGEGEYRGDVTYRFYLGQDDTGDFNITRNTENTVTLIPSREAITRPSWKIDAGEVYADVSAIIISSSGTIAVKDKGTINYFGPQAYASWNKIVKGNGIYVISGDYRGVSPIGYVGASSNGYDWTIRQYLFEDIAFGAGLFVGISKTAVYWSENGVNWQMQRLTDEYKELVAITYGNGQFLIVGDSGIGFTSPNGKIWTKISTTILFPYFAASGDGEFLTMSITGYICKCYGEDMTWDIPRDYVFDQTVSNFKSMDYGKGVYLVSGGNALFYSKDGINWKTTSFDDTYFDFAADYSDGIFAAASRRKWADGPLVVSTSLDGINWTDIASFTKWIIPADICIMY